MNHKIFAQIGESRQQVGGTCPDGWIEMQSERPGTYNIANADGTWGEEVLPAISCSKRQGELALLELQSPTPEHVSMLHWVESLIENTNNPIEKRKMQAYFNAYEWHSDDPFVIYIWSKAQKPEAELRVMFEYAQTL